MATLYTIGHSTRSIEEFTDLLHTNSVELLVDIRTVPRSRHNPQYEQSSLIKSLPKSRIEYRYLKNLGGLRPKADISVNQGWRNQSFRNYADYMQTDQFREALEELIEIAQKQTVAIMCAEAVPWRCHRSLVADAALIRNIEVLDIMSPTSTRPHKLTSFAVVDGTRITYPEDATTTDDIEP